MLDRNLREKRDLLYKGQVLCVKTNTHEGSLTFCQLISGFSSLLFFPIR